MKSIHICILLAVFPAVDRAQTPTITALTNNYSNIVPGLPDYGIARGSIFVIYGSNLAPRVSGLQSVPLKSTLNGVSISVTVNGATTNPLILALSPNQIDAILPSAAQAGTGTITLTNNGATSAAAPIQVVESAFGILTLNQDGTGMASVFDVNSQLLGVTSAANPGDAITLWGTGLGPVSGDESVAQSQTNLSLPIEVDIGGVAAKVLYQGRSQYPGLDQINVVVPAGVSGCAVSVAVVTGSNVSNFATIPVAASGRTCSDPMIGVSESQLQSILSKGTFSVGGISLVKASVTGPGGVGEGGHPVPGPTTTTEVGGASYSKVSVSPNFDFAALAQAVSLGSCTVYAATGSAVSIPTGIAPAPLNAGQMINVAGPTGTQSIALANGGYSARFPNGFLGAGTYRFDNGAGGPDVGPFSTQLTVPAPLTWSNMTSIYTIDRSSGVTVNWTGGDPSTYVTVSGVSLGDSAGGGQSLYGYFSCAVPVSAGSFTVPPAVLQALPPSAVVEGVSSSSLSVNNSTAPRPFSPSNPGLDYAFVQATFNIGLQVVYR
jgi:uncharacterized protein (TIGR03437 family)